MDIGRSLFSVFSFSRLSIQHIRMFFLLIPMAVFSNIGQAQQAHNILLIIADDIGVDMIGAYKPLVGSNSPAVTPTIDGLAAQGILFRNAWADPLCAATRATIQTGRYGFRTGVKNMFGPLPANEFSIGKMLHRDPANHHALALFGKWGLGAGQSDPVHMGYDEFKGVLAPAIPSPENYNNYTENSASFSESSSCDQHVPASYTDAACVHTGSSSVTVYATKKNADDTIAWINAVHNQSGGVRPWFVTLAFNAPHDPIHVPAPVTRVNGTTTTDL
ncbi:MAG TPA: sulfatase-like hydrolase/transferase, partial [Spongiibacteraceae bacterium]|nr:sulfatase-like hydrolase/transferase [Spongiibacteraceae bacterium]